MSMFEYDPHLSVHQQSRRATSFPSPRGFAADNWNTVMYTRSDNLHRNWGLTAIPAWANVWHVRKVLIPRRTITGRLVWGEVLRRHDGRKWIYRKLTRRTD